MNAWQLIQELLAVAESDPAAMDKPVVLSAGRESTIGEVSIDKDGRVHGQVVVKAER